MIDTTRIALDTPAVVRDGMLCAECRRHPVVLPHKMRMSEQFADFFTRMFDVQDWPPGWYSGIWTDFHAWMYIISDLVIFAACLAIPFMLLSLIKKRSDIPYPKVVWLFIAFISLCGATELLDAIAFWWPAYRVSAVVKVATGIVSLIAVYALYKVLPLMYSLRTVGELEHEIKEREIAEAKLAASEFLLTEAERIGGVGGWELDLNIQKRTWSKTVYEIYQLPYGYDINSFDQFDYFLEPSRQQVKEAIARTLKTGAKWDLELQLVTAKNVTIWVRSIGEVLHNENGKPVKLRGVFMNIDNYKTNELALHKSLDMLTKSNQQLKNFTHILSHNIRNHASNISLLTSMVDMGTLDEDNAELFDKIGKVSTGLNNTLNDLGEILQIRNSMIAPEWLSFKEATDHVMAMLETDINRYKATITTSFDIADVSFPKVYLESCIMNLISNALKYSKETEAPRIHLRSYKDEQGNTVFECSDNGIGIDLNLHGNRIFGLYKTFHEHKDAHGVGLYLVKTQVEAQGGVITVDSELGRGTTFKIVFDEKD